jgi:hypothetical protein
VKQHNELYEAGLLNYALEINHLSHLPSKESQTGLLALADSNSPLPLASRVLPPECQDLPAMKNWVTEKKVSTVKDQLKCGSSYLLSAVAALESAASIEFASNIVDLSNQHCLECVKNMTGGKSTGCTGGRPEWIWKYARDQGGLVMAAAYSRYSGNPQRACASGFRRDSKSTVSSFSRINRGDEDMMKCRVARFGPVVAGITTKKTNLGSYKTGIFDDSTKACASNRIVDHVNFVGRYVSVSNRFRFRWF